MNLISSFANVIDDVNNYFILLAAINSIIYKKMVAKNKPLRAALANVEFPAVVAFGNPLLDIIVHLDSDEILNKFNLKTDEQREVTPETIQEILAEISPK